MKELLDTLDQLEKLIPESRLKELNECREMLKDPIKQEVDFVRAWIRSIMALERIEIIEK